MSKVQHSSLHGKLIFDESRNEYLVDGFSVLDVLEQMVGLEVQLEIVGYEKTPTPQQPEQPPTDDGFLKKLLGGD